MGTAVFEIGPVLEIKAADVVAENGLKCHPFGTKVPPKFTSSQSAALSDNLKLNDITMERIHTGKQK